NGTQASAQADKIDTLLNVMIVLSSFVFAIVLVMLGYCIWKYRAKPGDESDGEPIHGNTKLEITWTAIPTVIVLFGAIYSWIVLGDIETKAADALPVDVTAQQYEWTFARWASAGGASDVARRDPFILGAGVADQARRGSGRARRQRHRQLGRGDARQAGDLQRGLYRALRVRPRHHASAGEGRAGEGLQPLAWTPKAGGAAAGHPHGRYDRRALRRDVVGWYDDDLPRHHHDPDWRAIGSE
ncbi:MAG: cytochrome c oxidase subunit II, partial [Actinobacteria bacterium]